LVTDKDVHAKTRSREEIVFDPIKKTTIGFRTHSENFHNFLKNSSR